MASKNAIDSFLACRRLAIIGVSRDPKDFSRSLFRPSRTRVRRRAGERNGGDIDGRPAVRRIADVEPPIEAALLMIPKQASAAVVRECAAAGVERVWLYRAAGDGAVSGEAVAAAREHGLELVEGACPFMFLPGTGVFHRLHGLLHRMSGHLEA